MPFREAFDCLWCGRAHRTRSGADLEGWAGLCPDCVGRAGDNGFLRYRLRAAIRERAHAAEDTSRDPDQDMRAYYAARAPEYDDWYLRRGRYSRGPVHDLAWQTELDQATQWLDWLPLRGELVELAAGTGWWSPLLAEKGELSLYDAVSEPLDLARERLLAHGLRAHIHVRDAWEAADRRVDGVFCGFWLSHVPRARLGESLSVIRGWLKPGGRFAFVDSRSDPASGAVDQGPVTDDGMALRRLADGREFRIRKVYYEPDELCDALIAAGFEEATVRTTARFFLLGTGVAPAG